MGGSKMLKIAICDDDVHELSRISNMLNQYKTEKKAPLKFDIFSNPFQLLECMKCKAYGVLFLDVLMPGMNGLATAHEIRTFDSDVKIIFLTSSPEFAVESYNVKAHYYLLKPCTTEKLFHILDRIFLEKMSTEEMLSIMQPSGLIRFPIGKMEFLEVYSKKLMFHFSDGSLKEIRGSLSDFENKLLCKNNFFKVHRSYIINMEYIQSINAKEITTYSGQIVPVSRLISGKLKEAYMQFLFMEKED